MGGFGSAGAASRHKTLHLRLDNDSCSTIDSPALVESTT
jgi:hypothetical protein